MELYFNTLVSRMGTIEQMKYVLEQPLSPHQPTNPSYSQRVLDEFRLIKIKPFCLVLYKFISSVFCQSLVLGISLDSCSSRYCLQSVYFDVVHFRSCDPSIRDAVCTVIWVTPHLQAEVPEMKQITQYLTTRYGKEFAKDALENNSNCVSDRVCEYGTLL